MKLTKQEEKVIEWWRKFKKIDPTIKICFKIDETIKLKDLKELPKSTKNHKVIYNMSDEELEKLLRIIDS